MSKGIFLYSEDKKYKCAFELSDTLDKYQIPDHSVMILFEEREDGNYVIAEARDKILVTEKDKKIAELEDKLAESEKEIKKLKEVVDAVDTLKQFNADMNDYALVNKDVADEIYCEHQDKISFAVEQLEKVKSIINASARYDHIIWDFDIKAHIDQLIAEIKGE